MKKELKERWVAALRSGEYKQTREYLCDEQGWCCLGVLCNLVDKNKWISSPEDCETYALEYDFGDSRLNHEFPDEDWLVDIGLIPSLARDLAYKNDNYETFVDIADYIEENVNAVD